ncbi:DHHC palmitoyltransferase, putative [Angomonas deanei]|uniref:Palmitoyltransferase n=1 Tax=Angomonas deanei TaxID=59799 RepID=A0A7G2CJN5_9TRYP|nr:DHHC palmitoyltransferase, putative [Angomonas deanei]
MMLIFGIVLSVISLIAVFMYIIIMGPTRYHKDGFVGKLYKVLVALPTIIGGCCCSVCFKGNQKKGREMWKRSCSGCCSEKNILMPLFYIGVVWTAEYFYLFRSLPHLEATLLSKFVSWALVILSEVLWLLSCFSNPGIVTREGDQELQKLQYEEQSAKPKGKGDKKGGPHHQKKKNGKKFLFSPEEEYILNRRYVVDGVVHALNGNADLEEEMEEWERDYRSPEYRVRVGFGQQCTSCRVTRPARSRHCRMCDNCVRRYDHHCPWIYNDVAEGTHRYFLSFLLCHAISCTWSTWDSYTLIKQFLVKHNAWGWRLIRYGREHPLKLFDYVAIVVSYHLVTGCLIFFTFCIGIILYAFWSYQMSFVRHNITMNDYIKMEDASMFIAGLPSLDLVYREASRVRQRLEAVAARKPRKLPSLEEPPLPMTAKGYEEGGRKNKQYRKKVRKMVMYDLKGLYDRGLWNNIMEVYFPYRILKTAKKDMENNEMRL